MIIISSIIQVFPLYFISRSIRKEINRSVGFPLKRASSIFTHALTAEFSNKTLDSLIQEANIEELKVLFTKMREHLHRLEKFESELKKSVTEQAIARTTQSLAHDVRKPFTLFKMIIDSVESEEDPLQAKRLLSESLPEVQQAIASVNGMISDVLEIGSESATPGIL